MKAKIYAQSKNTMQSGRAKVGTWVFELDAKIARNPDSLMGWVSADNTSGQVRLTFSSCEEAVAYADRQNIAYQIMAGGTRKVKPRNYSDNFKYIPEEKKK